MSVTLDIDDDAFAEAFPFVAAHTPTVAEVRRLNKESIAAWPLPVLLACLDAGVDLENQAEWRVRFVFIETPELVDAALVVSSPQSGERTE